MRDNLTALSTDSTNITARLRLLIAGFTIAIVTIYGLSTGLFAQHNQAFADASKIVSLYVDGHKRIITTDAGTVGDLLTRLNVTVGKDDLVEPKVTTPIPQGFFNINIYRARPVVVVDGTTITKIRTAYQSPRLIADAAGINSYPEDQFQTDVITNFVSDASVGQQISIHRAKPLTVVADGKTRKLRTQQATVAGVLKEKGLPLGPKDTVNLGLTTQVTPGLKLVITRVSEAVTTVDETLPQTITTVTDPNQPKGTSTIIKPGSDGHRTVTYDIHYHDGVETSRDTLKVDNVVQPVAKVMSVGTKVAFSGNVEYWRPFVIQAAAATGVDPNLMLAIMKCESNGNANSSNGSHFGLFQYSASTWTSYGNSMSAIFDGPTQINVTAGRLSQKNPTSPWTASQHCWGPLIQ